MLTLVPRSEQDRPRRVREVVERRRITVPEYRGQDLDGEKDDGDVDDDPQHKEERYEARRQQRHHGFHRQTAVENMSIALCT